MPDIDRPATTIEDKFLCYRREKASDPDAWRRFPKSTQLNLLYYTLGATHAEALRIQALPVGPGTPMERGQDLVDIVLERDSLPSPFSESELKGLDESLVAEAPMEAVVDSGGDPAPPENDAPGPQPVHYCEICERSFGSGAALVSHEKSKAHIARQTEAEATPAMAAVGAADGATTTTRGTASGSMDVDDSLLE